VSGRAAHGVDVAVVVAEVELGVVLELLAAPALLPLLAALPVGAPAPAEEAVGVGGAGAGVTFGVGRGTDRDT
jgi:hypothetical protein